VSKLQVTTLDDNVRIGILEFKIDRPSFSGIRGMWLAGAGRPALPGMTVVCGGFAIPPPSAFLPALAHASVPPRVELCWLPVLVAKKMKNMLVKVEGQLGVALTAS